jgi:hypothetical protein
VRILKVESLVLKKKREYEREEEGDTHEGLYIEGCQHSWGPIRHVERQPYWCPIVYCGATKVYVYTK